MVAKINQLFASTLARTIVLAVVGLWFLILPSTVYTVVKWVIVAALLAAAIPDLFNGLKQRRATGIGGWALTRGVTLLIAALLVAVLLKPVISMLPALIGILVILFGINKVTTAKKDQRFINVSPIPQIIYGVVIIIAGAVLLLNPFHAVLVLFQATGALMLVMAVMEVVTAIRAKHN
ncbi:DUF308 domain-containing protein [Lacticaseibacillus sp. N501-2]|uniref:DUF308 domain-containing protein n=1 Tax=Lacticaseibacillus salsurae TaxID=3367729 RepID=UPI0038B2FA7E